METPAVPIRTVAIGRGADWIAEGFELFRQKPGVWIGLLLIWFFLSAVLSAVPGLNLVGTFIGPIFTAGLMLGCASQARGEGIRIEHLFAAFRSGRLGQLLMLTVWTILFTVVLVIIGCAAIFVPLWPQLHGIDWSASPSAELIAQHLDILSVLLIVLVVLALALLLAMALWFAPPLVVLRNVGALDAMKMSMRGCGRNLLPFLVYGALLFVVLILALIPFGLGLLVAGPVMVASVYTSFRDIYPPQA